MVKYIVFLLYLTHEFLKIYFIEISMNKIYNLKNHFYFPTKNLKILINLDSIFIYVTSNQIFQMLMHLKHIYS